MHGRYPNVDIWGDRIRFTFCCEAFRQQLTCQLDLLMYQAIHEDMANELRRIMRGKGRAN